MNVIELFRKACLCMMWMIIISSGVHAQTSSPSLDKKIQVPAKEVNIITLGDIITAQTGLILSFNAQKITAQKQLWLRHSSYSIQQLLSMIKEATGAEYTIYREHIIFHRIISHNTTTSAVATSKTAKQAATSGANVHTVPKPVSTPANHISTKVTQLSAAHFPRKARSKTPSLSDSHSHQQAPAQITGSSNDSNNRQEDSSPVNTKTGITTNVTPESTDDTPVNIANDRTMTGKQRQSLLSYITLPAIAITPAKPAAPALLSLRPMTQFKKQRRSYEKPGLFKPFVSTGFAADEVLYANLQVGAGVTLLYGIAAWSTNFSVSGFRYGAGSSYPLKNGWLIQLEATTGKLSKASVVRPVFDTSGTQFTLNTNSRLQRINLLAQKHIATHWSVYAGPVFNHLKSVYHRDAWQISPAFIETYLIAGKKDYQTVQPPYTLSDSPADKLENVKTWIGLQIGINYRF